MNKKSLLSTIAYLCISLCLCAGLISYTGPAITEEMKLARAMAETDVVEGPEFVIEIAEEEVPLGATKITTKVSTKTSTKKTKMSKAAKKTSKSTNKKTKTTTRTSKSSVKRVEVKTTVLTTTVTSLKKASKVKTIKTTVKTTVKTTETQLGVASNTGTNSNTSTSTSNPAAVAVNTNTFAISSFDDIKGRIDDTVYRAFKQLGFSYQCDPSISTTGVFSIKNHWIKLRVNNGYYLMHELGHFVSALKDYADTTGEWNSIYSAEKGKYTGSNKNYVTSTPSEYFAESFRDYSVNPGELQRERPKTYNYMHRMVTSITQEDIEIFDDYYSLFW